MTKRNQRDVVDARWEKKESTGRKVKDEEHSYRAEPVKPRNQFQVELLRALATKQVIVVDGSAGIGKSFVTMSVVSDMLKAGTYNKLLLSRPAVGMGHTVGLLKGDMRAKYEPYLLPLVDVLCERYGKGFYEASLGNGVIEFCPLEYVRGRNFSCVAIVDEMQNVTPSEAYTLITRVATGGKLILIGDSTQRDIPGPTGLQWIEWFAKRHGLEDVFTVIKTTSDDIVRGDVCKRTVKAMEKDIAEGVRFGEGLI